jgi:hypothetical protein
MLECSHVRACCTHGSVLFVSAVAGSLLVPRVSTCSSSGQQAGIGATLAFLLMAVLCKGRAGGSWCGGAP